MPSRGHNQDGGGRYSQSPLEPVLVNMVPAPDPEPPRGTGGGEAETEEGGRCGEKPCDRAGALRAKRRIGLLDSTHEAAREQRMRGSSVV